MFLQHILKYVSQGRTYLRLAQWMESINSWIFNRFFGRHSFVILVDYRTALYLFVMFDLCYGNKVACECGRRRRQKMFMWIRWRGISLKSVGHNKRFHVDVYTLTLESIILYSRLILLEFARTSILNVFLKRGVNINSLWQSMEESKKMAFMSKWQESHRYQKVPSHVGGLGHHIASRLNLANPVSSTGPIFREEKVQKNNFYYLSALGFTRDHPRRAPVKCFSALYCAVSCLSSLSWGLTAFNHTVTSWMMQDAWWVEVEKEVVHCTFKMIVHFSLGFSQKKTLLGREVGFSLFNRFEHMISWAANTVSHRARDVTDKLDFACNVSASYFSLTYFIWFVFNSCPLWFIDVHMSVFINDCWNWAKQTMSCSVVSPTFSDPRKRFVKAEVQSASC